MKAIETGLPGVLVFEPKLFGDTRGFFLESWNARVFDEAVGREVRFVQDNHSRSARHVLRGLHYQLVRPQAKLVRVVAGEIFDVAVDVRRSSPTFGRWTGARLSADNRLEMWIPEGFAHGFLVLSESADVLYKSTDHWFPEHERSIAWSDPTIAIDWPLDGAEPVLAAKDRAAGGLQSVECYP
jgi:dTDP-4-dehydrorhamnose 3,5-epimerase